MLPAYIIEELLKKERDRKRSSNEVFIELPLHDGIEKRYDSEEQVDDFDSFIIESTII